MVQARLGLSGLLKLAGGPGTRMGGSERHGASNPLVRRDLRSNPGHSSPPANQVQRHAIRLHRHHVPAAGPFTDVRLGSDPLSPVRPGDVEAEDLTDPVPSQLQLPPTPGPWVRN
jgi:hypothetical protein